MTEAKEHWVYYVHPTRPGFFERATEAEEEAVRHHAAYLRDLLKEGTLVLAGPSFDPAYYPRGAGSRPLEMPAPGIVIFEADGLDAARRIMEGDPAVRAGVFKARLNAFRLSFVRR